ncbi:unnamed protein product [Lasius platythorax]|uniref:Uncharacterized protein n=1 Tax=Lasius platythorax TaxID=488582 RepID=A0AAV2NXL0_9HYME
MERFYTVVDDSSSRERSPERASSCRRERLRCFGGPVLGRDRRFCGPVLTVKLDAGETHGGTVNEISLRCALFRTYGRLYIHGGSWFPVARNGGITSLCDLYSLQPVLHRR